MDASSDDAEADEDSEAADVAEGEDGCAVLRPIPDGSTMEDK